MKKSLIILMVLIGFVLSMYSQAPYQFNYQAVARDASGDILKNTSVKIKISILQTDISGSSVYSETHSLTTNNFGLINLKIGTGDNKTGSFEGIKWGIDNYFLKIEMDKDAGNNFKLLGTSQLLSVPYSLYTSSIYVKYSNDTLYIGDQYVIISGKNPPPDGTITDFDGNMYATVVIGNQTWMKENLRSTHYADGTPIDSVWVYDNNESNATIWGRLYSWDAAMNGASSSNGNPSGVQGVCPDGWHLPSKAEFDELISFVGSGVGWKLKETGNTYWDVPNSNTNETGFSARGSGGRSPYLYVYNNLKGITNFWSATEDDNFRGKTMILYSHQGSAPIHNNDKDTGYSVRCLKD